MKHICQHKSRNLSTHPSPRNNQIDSHLVTFRLDFNIWFFLVTSCDDCTWRWNRITNEVLVEISNFHINFTKIPLLHVPLLFPSSSKGCMLSSHWCRPSQALGPSTDGPKTYINQPFHFNSDFRFMNIEYRLFWARVAGLGRLSAGANMAMKPFVKRVITIFATNASFLRVISNFRI